MWSSQRAWTFQIEPYGMLIFSVSNLESGKDVTEIVESFLAALTNFMRI